LTRASIQLTFFLPLTARFVPFAIFVCSASLLIFVTLCEETIFVPYIASLIRTIFQIGIWPQEGPQPNIDKNRIGLSWARGNSVAW